MIDGVIKYHFDFQVTKPLEEGLFSEIELLRERLFALNLIGVTEDGVGFGNISQRVDANSFVITGTQTGHLEKLDATLWLNKYAIKDDKYFMPVQKDVKDFVEYYFNRYKEIGQELDKTDSKENYLNGE